MISLALLSKARFTSQENKMYGKAVFSNPKSVGPFTLLGVGEGIKPEVLEITALESLQEYGGQYAACSSRPRTNTRHPWSA
jgi:hypothetical protein